MRGGGVGSLSRLPPDGRAFAVQTTVLPGEAGPVTGEAVQALATHCVASLERWSGGLLAVHRSRDGLILRLRGLRPPLLAFGPPSEIPEPDGRALAYPIVGGLLLRGGAAGGRLCFRVAQAPGGLRATLDVEGFPSALLALPAGRLLCRFVQFPLHAWVGRRLLHALRRQPGLLQGRPASRDRSKEQPRA